MDVSTIMIIKSTVKVHRQLYHMSTAYNVRDHVYVKQHGLKEFKDKKSYELHPRKYVVLFCWYRVTENQFRLLF